MCAEGKGGVDLTVSTIGVIGIALAVVVALVFLLTQCCRPEWWGISSENNKASSSNYFAPDSLEDDNGEGHGTVGGDSRRVSQKFIRKQMEDSSESDLSEEVSRTEQRIML